MTEPEADEGEQEHPTPERDAVTLLKHASVITDYQDERDPTRTAKLLMLPAEAGATILFYERGRPVFPRLGGSLSFTTAYLAVVGMQPVPNQASQQGEQSDVQR